MPRYSHVETFSDALRAEKETKEKKNCYSRYCDLIYYESSTTPGLQLAMLIYKPEKPGYIVASTHGWHMSIPAFTSMEDKPVDEYLRVYVDMRGRAFSDGEADCNGYELYDVIDAVEYVKKQYAAYVLDENVVYYSGGSGGGGNGYEILNKFPDYFAAATVMCGISDYAKWYEDDCVIGEFRDELDVWIGCAPDQNLMAYQSRSGMHGLRNLHTPLYIAHGNQDARVQICQAHRYLEEAERIGKRNLISYFEMDGVGGSDHFDNATQEQMEELYCREEAHQEAYRTPVTLPEQGSLIVHGYLVTKQFEVYLDSVDKVAELAYDLRNKEFSLSCEVPVKYRIILK
ncbi:MAG: hypothetical protein E7454_07295 [Ruminococcaceae bacterium]|nr:hypothetical protein [Oscillospiraceae bacterium]